MNTPKNQHTPGPWRVEGRSVLAGMAERVAEVGYSEAAQENARLIANAPKLPELLDALRAALGALDLAKEAEYCNRDCINRHPAPCDERCGGEMRASAVRQAFETVRAEIRKVEIAMAIGR